MIAYKKYGKNKKPTKKSDHFVGDFYVKFNQMIKENKDYEKKAQECLQKWEAKDKETLDLWKKMNKWALDGFKETYKIFGIKHDKEYYESKIYKKGKEIVGFIASYITIDDRKDAYISELQLKSKYQKRGIGKELMNSIENKYKKKGVEEIRLVTKRKAGAFKFYKKLKYKVKRCINE